LYFTAESAQASLHLEAEKPYVFRQVEDRPITRSLFTSTAGSKPGQLSRESTFAMRSTSRLRGYENLMYKMN